jgi:hypothetical protein
LIENGFTLRFYDFLLSHIEPNNGDIVFLYHSFSDNIEMNDCLSYIRSYLTVWCGDTISDDIDAIDVYNLIDIVRAGAIEDFLLA